MSLSWIQSRRIAAALEDCTHRLDILGHTLTEQMTRETSTTPAQEKVQLIKLARDCQFISQQITALHLELEEKQSFSSLLQAVEEEQTRKEKMKRPGNAELKQKKQTLQRKQQEAKDKTKKLDDMHALLRQLRDEAVLRKKIVQKSIVLKSQMKQKEARKAENLLAEQLKLLKKQLREEERVHEESGKLLQNQHEELQRVLHEWQQSSKQMLQEKQNRLDNVCCKRTLNLDRLMEMRRKFREMEQLVMEDKKEQEQLRQLEAKAKAASMLQAWWRGCMVRQGLGSFKKAEVDKKDKKKKKGKKKK